MLYFYLYSTAITAISLGCIFLKNKIIRGSKTASFLIGFSSVPFVQFLWTMALVLLFRNGTSRYMYILPIPAVASVFIGVMLIHSFRSGWSFDLRSLKRNIWKLIKGDKKHSTLENLAMIGLFAISVVSWIFLSYKLSVTSQFIESDTMEYFHKASYFANHRELSALSYVNGIPNGSGVADHHFPSYTAYLAYAFMHTTADVIGFPHHEAALFAGSLVMVLCLLASIMGLYCIFDGRGLHFLGVPATLWMCMPLVANTFGSPRDMFRFCAFCVFLAFLTNYLQIEKTQKRDIGIMALAAFVGASAHVLNFVLVFLSLGAYVVYIIWTSIESRNAKLCGNYVPIAVSILAGALLSFAGNICNFFVAGKWTAVRLDFSKYDFYADYSAFLTKSDVEIPMLQRWSTILYLDVSNLGAMLAIGFLLTLIYVFIRRKEMDGKLRFFALVVLFIALPLSGVLDIEKLYRFSYYFTKVPRYGLPFFLFTLTWLWMFFWHMAEKFRASRKGWTAFIDAVCTIGICLVVTWYAADNLFDFCKYAESFTAGNEGIHASYGELIEAFSDYDKRILTNRQIGYVLGENALMHTSVSAEPLYHIDAADREQAEKIFKSLNIGAVVLTNNSAQSSASVLPWYDFVTTLPVKELNGYEVYYLE